MRVITRGKLPEERKRRASCPRCMSRIEYTEKDVRSCQDSSGFDRYLKCPVCSHYITVK